MRIAKNLLLLMGAISAFQNPVPWMPRAHAAGATASSSSNVSYAVPVYRYQIVNTYPHDPQAFTQGLAFDAGFFYESTGLYGQSTLRKVRLETGEVLRVHRLLPEHFGEGLALWRDRLYQLTWKSRVGFVYDKEDFRRITEFRYPTEGWGLTQDGTHLIMSDGTATLRFLDPTTFQEVRNVQVHDRGIPVIHLNELETVKGEIYANVWTTDRIARISPETGQVLGWIDLTGLRDTLDCSPDQDVLNGIAYDADSDRLFVTGKRWPKLFEIQLLPLSSRGTAPSSVELYPQPVASRLASVARNAYRRFVAN